MWRYNYVKSYNLGSSNYGQPQQSFRLLELQKGKGPDNSHSNHVNSILHIQIVQIDEIKKLEQLLVKKHRIYIPRSLVKYAALARAQSLKYFLWYTWSVRR